LSNPADRPLYNHARHAVRSTARTLARALHAALPPACALCSAAGASICDRCARMLAHDGPACPGCALPSPAGARCGRCLAHPPAFDAAVAAGPYAFPLDRLIMRLKYGGALDAVAPLGARLAAAVHAADALRRVDALVALPLSPQRQRERGHNQAGEIARVLACSTGLPRIDALRRVAHGPPQASLPWRERARNARRAFEARGRVDGARIALVDDVMTTGSTAAAAAATLKRAGAARVEAWVVARTPRPAGAP